MQTLTGYMKKHKRLPSKKGEKLQEQLKKTPNALEQGLFNPQELENRLTTPRAFDNPGVKGVLREGKAIAGKHGACFASVPTKDQGGLHIRAPLYTSFVVILSVTKGGYRKE